MVIHLMFWDLYGQGHSSDDSSTIYWTAEGLAVRLDAAVQL